MALSIVGANSHFSAPLAKSTLHAYLERLATTTHGVPRLKTNITKVKKAYSDNPGITAVE